MDGIVELEIPDTEGFQETFAESTGHCHIETGPGHA